MLVLHFGCGRLELAKLRYFLLLSRSVLIGEHLLVGLFDRSPIGHHAGLNLIDPLP